MTNTSDLLMPIAIAIIMFGIGITLKFKDFRRVFLKPKAILTGLSLQMLALPVLAFALIYFWPIAPIYKAGFILIAAAPGGTASNLVTHMLKGRVALSVSLTSFNSLAILVTIPVFVSLALRIFLGKETEVNISFENTFREILFTVVAPVIAGILTNHYTPDRFTQRLYKPMRIILPSLLLLVFFLAFFNQEGEDSGLGFFNNLELYFPLLLLNFSTMLIGYVVAKKVGIKHDGCYTIAVEMGLQNSALAIFIASSVLNSPKMATVAVIYTSFSFISTWLFGWILKHRFN